MNARAVIEAESPKQFIKRAVDPRRRVDVPTAFGELSIGVSFRLGSAVLKKVSQGYCREMDPVGTDGDRPYYNSYALHAASTVYPLNWPVAKQRQWKRQQLGFDDP
jgi:hypothetical protein